MRLNSVSTSHCHIFTTADRYMRKEQGSKEEKGRGRERGREGEQKGWNQASLGQILNSKVSSFQGPSSRQIGHLRQRNVLFMKVSL